MFDTRKPFNFPLDVENVLRQHGWHPSRQVPEEELKRWYVIPGHTIADYHRIIPSALRVLREFGGIHIKQDAPGITCWRSSFIFDPLKALDILSDGWTHYEWVLNQQLYPIGISLDSESFVCVDLQDRVYGISEQVSIWANSSEQAIINIIRGVNTNDVINIADYPEKLMEARKVDAALESATAITKTK